MKGLEEEEEKDENNSTTFMEVPDEVDNERSTQNLNYLQEFTDVDLLDKGRKVGAKTPS